MFTAKIDLIRPLCACACENGYFRMIDYPDSSKCAGGRSKKGSRGATVRCLSSCSDNHQRMPLKSATTTPPKHFSKRDTEKATTTPTSVISVDTSVCDASSIQYGAGVFVPVIPLETLDPQPRSSRKAYCAREPAVVLLPRLNAATDQFSRCRPPEDLVGCPPIDRNICPITRRRMVHPVLCVDGHWYDESALCEWISRFHASPISGRPLVLSFYVKDVKFDN